MPVTAMPAINVEACSGWSEDDVDAYNSLPFYLTKMQVERRKTWGLWSKFTQKRKWKPSQGDTMRAVRTAPSPHIRQFAYPSPLRSIPRKDMMNVREVSADAQVYRHRFESPALYFFPSFNDFMDHVDDTGNDIMEKIERYEDVFIRTNIWHMAPYVFVCKANGDVDLLDRTDGVPVWEGTGTFTEGTTGKTTNWLKGLIDAGTIGGNLTLTAINKAFTIMETDLRVPPFTGTGQPQGNDNPLSGMYALTTSSEAFNNFIFDPWLLNNKNCDLDVVFQSFRGKLWGKVTTGIEDLPMRCTTAAVFNQPEVRVATDDAFSEGDTEPNQEYTDPAQSPIEIGFLAGGMGYESIEVGPPPSSFTGDTPPHNFPSMFWNGEVRLTKQFLVPCYDASGNLYYEQNNYGEYLKFISQIALGIIAKQRRNVIPIIYQRKRGQ